MTKKVLGLDINEDSITAVQVKGLLKGYQITACATVRIEGDAGLDNALKGLFDKVDLKSDTCITSIPGEHVSYRNLEMPFRDLKKLRQTVPFEIETMVPFSIDDLVIDFIISDRSGHNEILAASVRKSFVSEYLTSLKSHEIYPDILDIRCMPIATWLLKQQGGPNDALFLEIGEKRTTMVLYLKRHIVLIRTFSFNNGPIAQSIFNGMNNIDITASEQIESHFKHLCTTVRNTIHAFGWQRDMPIRLEKIFFTGIGALYPETENFIEQFFNIPAEQINLSRDNRIRMDENISQVWNPLLMDSALALALRDSKQGQGFNFRKDEFKIERRWFSENNKLRKIAAFLIIIFSLLAADIGVDYYLIKERYSALDQKVTKVFRQTFPDVKRIVDPVKQMKVKIREIKRAAISQPGIKSKNKVLDLLKDISQRVPKSLNLHVTRIVINPETLRIIGKTDTFNTVDKIKNSLKHSSYFNAVTISSANLDRTKKHVRFELKLQRIE